MSNLMQFLISALLLSAVDAKSGGGPGGTTGDATDSGAAVATKTAVITNTTTANLGPFPNTKYADLSAWQKTEYFYYFHKAEMIVIIAVVSMFLFVQLLMKRMKDRDENFRK